MDESAASAETDHAQILGFDQVFGRVGGPFVTGSPFPARVHLLISFVQRLLCRRKKDISRDIFGDE